MRLLVQIVVAVGAMVAIVLIQPPVTQHSEQRSGKADQGSKPDRETVT